MNMVRKKDTLIDGIAQEFNKEQIISSKRFSKQRDLVEALLDNEKKYTMEQVNEKIHKYMKGKVK